MVGECDVCVLVDGDHSLKEVGYCSICDAHICQACQPNLVKRANAMRIRKWGNFFRSIFKPKGN